MGNLAQSNRISSIEDGMKDLKNKLIGIGKDTAVLVSLENDIRANSQFRNQARGAIGFAAFIFTALGAGIMWLVNKFYS